MIKVKDWQERTEALVVKRRADREALKDAERNRIQLQSLEEFKVRIMEQHADVKKELRDERKRREDLAEEFDTFREDMGEARVFLIILRRLILIFWTLKFNFRLFCPFSCVFGEVIVSKK